MNEAVGQLDDAVVVGHHDDRGAVLDGQILEEAHDIAGRIGIEGGGRLVGQDQPRAVGKGARDRHPLALAARQLARLVVDAGAEPEALQHGDAALAHLRARMAAGELQRHLHILVGGQRFEEIVHLEDKADVAPDMHEIAGGQPGEIMAHQVDPALLDRAQRADQGQQRGLPRARRAGHHHQLPGLDRKPDVEQHLVLCVALAVVKIDGVDPHHRVRLEVGFVEDRSHQKTSAGSAAITRRIARSADMTHMTRVRPRLSRVSCHVMLSGSSARAPITR